MGFGSFFGFGPFRIDFGFVLVLLHRQLDKIQMGSPEAGQTLVCPGSWISGVLLVRALLHFGTGLGRITVLAQLLDKMFDVKSVGIVEQTHFHEDALNVGVSFLVIGEVPRFVLGDLFFGDAQGGHTFCSVLAEIFVGLDLPFIGVDLIWN